jgi:hypothetical protein
MASDDSAPQPYYEPIPGKENGEEEEEYKLPENATPNDYVMHPYKYVPLCFAFHLLVLCLISN